VTLTVTDQSAPGILLEAGSLSKFS
jgi:hypothetical protein